LEIADRQAVFRFPAEWAHVYCLDAARQTGVVAESSHALGPGSL
jgi:hypothetical protein